MASVPSSARPGGGAGGPPLCRILYPQGTRHWGGPEAPWGWRPVPQGASRGRCLPTNRPRPPLSTNSQGGPPGLGCLATPSTRGSGPTPWSRGSSGGTRGDPLCSTVPGYTWWYPWGQNGGPSKCISGPLLGSGSQTQTCRGGAPLQGPVESRCSRGGRVCGGQKACPQPWASSHVGMRDWAFRSASISKEAKVQTEFHVKISNIQNPWFGHTDRACRLDLPLKAWVWYCGLSSTGRWNHRVSESERALEII